MRRNSSGDKTEETWKAGERADGIRLASQRWQSLSVCLSSITAQTERLFYCLGTRFSIWQIITLHPVLQWVSLTVQLVILKRTATLDGRPRKGHIERVFAASCEFCQTLHLFQMGQKRGNHMTEMCLEDFKSLH